MYFWNLEALKQELRAGHLGNEAALRYLLWYGGVVLVAFTFPYADSWTHWVTPAWLAVEILVFVLGTLRVYRLNGSALGTDFLGRYVSLSWVFGLRFIVLVSIPATVALVLCESMVIGDDAEGDTVLGALVGIGLSAAYYWRLGDHFEDLRVQDRSADSSLAGPQSLD